MDSGIEGLKPGKIVFEFHPDGMTAKKIPLGRLDKNFTGPAGQAKNAKKYF